MKNLFIAVTLSLTSQSILSFALPLFLSLISFAANKLSVLAPYLALIGVVAAVAALVKRRKI